MCGGSSEKTDRGIELGGFGKMSDVYNTMRTLGGSLTSAGATDTGAASKYYSSLLSGNPAAVSAATAPETNAITSEASQQKKQMSEFGNRTGGKVAAAQDITSGTRGAIADTIAKERSGAAGGLAKIGAGETGAGLGAEGGAGDIAGNITSKASSSRELSAELHDRAVSQWADLISSALS
jgi:hypothetical protein